MILRIVSASALCFLFSDALSVGRLTIICESDPRHVLTDKEISVLYVCLEEITPKNTHHELVPLDFLVFPKNGYWRF